MADARAVVFSSDYTSNQHEWQDRLAPLLLFNRVLQTTGITLQTAADVDDNADEADAVEEVKTKQREARTRVRPPTR